MTSRSPDNAATSASGAGAARIDWTYSGPANLFMGTGASAAELWLGWGAAAGGCALVALADWAPSGPGWTWWQYVLAALFAFDVFGGVVANALNSCKRLYHAPVKPDEPGLLRLLKRHPLAFTALHVHAPLIVLAFPGAGWTFGAFWYLGAVAAHAAILSTPLYLQRPLSFVLIAAGVVVNGTLVPAPPGFAWFGPLITIKLLYAHGVREEPYRPRT